jgi:signal transduction histidine kinase
VGIRAYLSDLAAARQAASDAYHMLEANNDRLDETVRHRTADLTAANEEIQRFAYIVSHDLRAPLVNIMGFTSELEHATGILTGFTAGADVPGDVREAATEDIPEALRFIKASTSKMDRLINAILKLSREGRRVLTAERLDMRAMFETLVDTMGHQAASVDVTIASDLPSILADRIATEQVFGNIIDNALKYLEPGRPGRIGVAGGIEGGMARYDISDNGRGIAERDFERVFELFRRAGNQTVPGEGIGLAHVRALVRRMGGSIDCRSTIGVGSVFTVRLPVVGQYA